MIASAILDTPVAVGRDIHSHAGFRPLLNQVMILPDNIPLDRKERGLWVPQTAKQVDRFDTGTVVAVGEGWKCKGSGKRQALECKVGNKVLYGYRCGEDREFDGKTYRLIPEERVMAILED